MTYQLLISTTAITKITAENNKSVTDKDNTLQLQHKHKIQNVA